MRLKEKFLENVRKPQFLIVLALVIVGIVLRSYALGAQSLWLDEGQSAIAARAFLEKGWPVVDHTEFTRGIIHTAMTALSFGAFGVSEASGRIPALIFGVLSIPLAFMVGRRMKNDRVGVILAFLITFATVQIAWSRQVRFYQQLQFFFLLSLYSMDRLMDRMRWKNFLILILAVLCMFHSHDQFGFLLALPLGIWFPIGKAGLLKHKILNPKETRLRDWIGFAILALAAAIVIHLRWSSIFEGLEHFLAHQEDWLSNYVEYFGEELGGIFYLAVPGAFLGVWKRRRNLMYVLAFLLPFLVVSYRAYAYQARHVFMLIPLLLAFASLMLDYVFDRVRGALSEFRINPVLKLIIPAAFVMIFVAILPLGEFTFAPKEYYDLGPTAPQGEFRPAHQYIERNWKENDVVITTIEPVTNFYMPDEKYRPFYEIPAIWSLSDTKRINSVEDIKSLENRGHGWVVIDGMGRYRILWGGHRELRGVLNYITGNFELVQVGRNQGVWVYRF